jgi:hypothetical protein
MKKILLFSLVIFSLAVRAQKFEGTITWAVKYEITDPAKRAEMEKSQKAMADPANQEKMKKMQEQMNTPEMKAMMDANPQMKARMESALKMMQGGDMGSIMPHSFIVKTKGLNSLTRMEGGMMATETLYLGDKKQAYIINRSAKTYTLMRPDSAHSRRTDTLKHTVTKTAETRKILNYTCTKYIVSIINRDTVNQVFWTTTEIPGLDMRNFSQQKMANSNQPLFYEGIAGVPLRLETGTRQANITMEVTGIKKETLPADDFAIPNDFKESKALF